MWRDIWWGRPDSERQTSSRVSEAENNVCLLMKFTFPLRCTVRSFDYVQIVLEVCALKHQRCKCLSWCWAPAHPELHFLSLPLIWGAYSVGHLTSFPVSNWSLSFKLSLWEEISVWTCRPAAPHQLTSVLYFSVLTCTSSTFPFAALCLQKPSCHRNEPRLSLSSAGRLNSFSWRYVWCRMCRFIFRFLYFHHEIFHL